MHPDAPPGCCSLYPSAILDLYNLAPAWLALLQVSDIYCTLSVPNIAALFVFVEISAFHTVLHMYMWVFWSQFQFFQTAVMAVVATEVLQGRNFHMYANLVAQENAVDRQNFAKRRD